MHRILSSIRSYRFVHRIISLIGLYRSSDWIVNRSYCALYRILHRVVSSCMTVSCIGSYCAFDPIVAADCIVSLIGLDRSSHCIVHRIVSCIRWYRESDCIMHQIVSFIGSYIRSYRIVHHIVLSIGSYRTSEHMVNRVV